MKKDRQHKIIIKQQQQQQQQQPQISKQSKTHQGKDGAPPLFS